MPSKALGTPSDQLVLASEQLEEDFEEISYDELRLSICPADPAHFAPVFGEYALVLVYRTIVMRIVYRLSAGLPPFYPLSLTLVSPSTEEAISSVAPKISWGHRPFTTSRGYKLGRRVRTRRRPCRCHPESIHRVLQWDVRFSRHTSPTTVRPPPRDRTLLQGRRGTSGNPPR